MSRVITYLTMFVSFPTLLFASADISDSDFIQRVINFVIFVAILWYFAFDPIKGLFVNRSNAIAARLNDVQDNLHKTKQEMEAAQKRLEKSKERAREIINAAKQEAYLVEQKYETQIKKDVEALKYVLESNIELERRRARQESVNKILDEVIKSDDVRISKEEYVSIITKRIS